MDMAIGPLAGFYRVDSALNAQPACASVAAPIHPRRLPMKRRYSIFLAATAAAALALVACSTSGPATHQGKMSFFITSTNPGKGGDFGGLAGADRYCQGLAESVGAGGRSWRAYLSTTATTGSAGVNARD